MTSIQAFRPTEFRVHLHDLASVLCLAQQLSGINIPLSFSSIFSRPNGAHFLRLDLLNLKLPFSCSGHVTRLIFLFPCVYFRDRPLFLYSVVFSFFFFFGHDLHWSISRLDPLLMTWFPMCSFCLSWFM